MSYSYLSIFCMVSENNFSTGRNFATLSDALAHLANYSANHSEQYFVAQGQDRRYTAFLFQEGGLRMPSEYKFVCIIRFDDLLRINQGLSLQGIA